MKIPDNLSDDDTDPEEITPRLWLMNNHRWAYYVWQKYALENPQEIPVILVHIDYHWDDLNDFTNPEKAKELQRIQTTPKIYKIVKENLFIKYDSFIAPAIIRGLFSEVHFHCLQESGDDLVFENFLAQYQAKQYIHDDINALIATIKDKSIILDIDLDIFNHNQDTCYRSDLWLDNEINTFIDQLQPLLQNAVVTTVAMSFGCSGTEEDTRKLVHLVLPKLESLMNITGYPVS